MVSATATAGVSEVPASLSSLLRPGSQVSPPRDSGSAAITMGDGGLKGERVAADPEPSVDTIVPKDGSVTVLRKSPPPESSTNIHIRSLVIVSFWLVVVCLGLPTWWWTTSIYRARLPLQEMLEWADGKVSSRSQGANNQRTTDQALHRPANRSSHYKS